MKNKMTAEELEAVEREAFEIILNSNLVDKFEENGLVYYKVNQENAKEINKNFLGWINRLLQ
tara:strand:+ start:4954 stop:5139 length:186 start_codon:yes stop_codon:yes gene_type:complete